jgi:uncharacterized protein (TIGR02266 family)
MTMQTISQLAPESTFPRRRHDRGPLEVEVTLESDHNFFAGFSENVSEGGLFVATHALRSIGATVALTFRVPNREQPIEVSAVVRWVRVYHEASDAPPGMGLQFIGLDAEDAAAIRAFVEHRAPLFWD